MTPPSPYRERVVNASTLQSAVSCVTVTALWLAARGVVGWPPPHCREGFRHGSASGPRACFPSHRPTPGRVPYLVLSIYALLGAPKGCISAMPLIWSMSRVGRWRVTLCYRSTFPPAPLRTGRAAFTASGSPVVKSAFAVSNCPHGRQGDTNGRPRESCAAAPP